MLGSLKDSAEAVKDLRGLVGPENMNQYARNTVQKAVDDAARFDKSGNPIGMDWKAFQKQVGLGSPGFTEMIKGTGVNPQAFEDLIKIASKIDIPPDLSTFVARRAQLGGLAALTKPLSAVGQASLILPIVLMRNSQTLLNNPKQVEQLRRAFMPGVPENLRNAAIGRVVQTIDRLAQTEGETDG